MEAKPGSELPRGGLVETNAACWKRWLLTAPECQALTLTAAQEREVAAALDAAGIACPLPRAALKQLGTVATPPSPGEPEL